MLSAGLAVEPPHRVGHGLGSSLGAGLGAGLGAALGAGLGPPSHHPMLQAFTTGEFLRPMPPHRWVPGEPGPGAAMFSPPDLRFWLHQQHQQHHLARYAAASQSVSHHRLPPQSPTPSPQAAPPPAPSPAPVNLSAGHKEDKERAVHSHSSSAAMGYHYPHYPMAAPMFPPAPYSPYGSRLPPPGAPADAPAAYSPPAGSPAPLPPPSHPAPKPAVASKTFKVPVPAGPPSGGKDSAKHRSASHAAHASHAAKHPPLVSTSTSMLPPMSSAAPIMTTTATPHHPMHAAPGAQEYHHPAAAAAPAATPAPATTLPQFWKGSFIRLASGELKRVQETKAEDFVASAERNPTLRADPATVVRIQSTLSCRVTIALSVGGSESEIETTSEHPFCVYGNGWASCSPERSLQLLGLNCRTLQVGDVVVSLTHRQQPQQQQQQHQQPPPKAPQRAQASSGARGGRGKKQPAVNLPPPTGHPRAPAHHLPGPGPAPGPASTPTADSAASMAGKKRRWSAPDQLAAAAAEEAQAAAQAAAAAGMPPSKLARVPE
ncbi:Ataxin-1 [Frankliniella fusca]|uniref:Ataxin-1 n=1 Tax=Frankliniella fusca TaxID=407009 RepID=A0AAE1LSG4_9NEOP|nr:Ataxin-1 [Frankliniella fusca]